MTDERQTLDSQLSTATAEPPSEPSEAPQPQAAAAGEPEAGAAEPRAQAAEGEAGEREEAAQAEAGGEVVAAAQAPTASDEESEARADSGETVAEAQAATASGEEGEARAAADETVAEAQAATAGDEEGEPRAGETAPDAAVAATADADGKPLAAVAEVAGEEEAEAAAAVAAGATDTTAAQATAEAPAAAPAAEAAEAAAPAADTAAETAPQAESTPAAAESTTSGAASAAAGEATTPLVEPSAASTPEPEPTPEPTPGAEAQPAAQAAETAAPAEAPAAAQAAETASPVAEAPPAAAAGEDAPAAETAAPVAEAPAAAEATPAAAAPTPAPEEPEDPALAALREAREKGTPVEGRVIGWNRGGFHVVVGAVTAFCPSSEMEVGRPKSPQSYMEKTFSFKVIKYQKKGRRVVLSRAAVLGEKRQQVLAELAPGTVATGRVTSLPDFGAFVDLGGVEGLVHVSEISRGRVQHPKDALQIGQEVAVKVLKVEQDGGRISLSMKDLEPDPWQGAGQRFGRGDRWSGKVLRKTDFGLFVELEPEVEGLLHVSQLPPGKSMDDAEYQPGQALEGWVREVEPKRQRISLTLREVPTDDPWKSIGQRFPEGESVEGTVESIAPFGVFIQLAPGVTGLLPNSQTGLPRGTNAARAFAPGQSVRVQVLSIDTRRKRISLGREGAHVEASKNDLQDFKKRQREQERETPTAMAAAFARLRERRDEQ